MSADMHEAMKSKLEFVCRELDSLTPKKIVFLQEETDWKFLIMVILTAQCTDKKVMDMKDSLFSRFRTLGDFADAELSDVEDAIRTLGLYKAKAKNIKETARILISEYGGRVPESFDDLTRLPGVGRKTANCIRGEVFSLPAVICDTHFIRLANRLGFVDTDDPVRVERFFVENMEPEKQYRFSMSANYFARNHCKSQRPECENCRFSDMCAYFESISKR